MHKRFAIDGNNDNTENHLKFQSFHINEQNYFEHDKIHFHREESEWMSEPVSMENAFQITTMLNVHWRVLTHSLKNSFAFVRNLIEIG